MNDHDDYREEKRHENLENSAGFTAERADEAITGIRHNLGVEAVRRTTNAERPHYSHRGGRAYPEPSDSERDPDWNVDSKTLTDEQVKVLHDNTEAIHATELQRKIDAVNDNGRLWPEQKKSEITRLLAIDRARRERR